jgi:hypothetical protein
MSNENRPTTVWTRQQGNVPNVAASGRGSMVLSGIANNLHYLFFLFRAAGGAVLTRAQLITDIARFEIKMGTEVIANVTTTRLLDLYKYYYDCYGALAAPLGVIPIPFIRPKMPAWDVGRAFGLGLKKNADPNDTQLHTLSYTVTFNAGLVTAATGELWVGHDIYDPETPGLHVRTIEITKSQTGTGVDRIVDLPRTHVGTLAYHWDAGTCTNMTVIKNGQVIMDNVNMNVMAIMQDMAGRTPQTNYTHLDFALSNDMNGYERLGAGVVEWDIRPTWTAAPGAGYTLLCEEIHDGVAG